MFNCIKVTTMEKGKYYIEFKSQRKRAADCTVRALMKLLEVTWQEAYDELCKAGRKCMRMPDEIDCVRMTIESFGYKKVSIPVEKGSKRPTVASFAEQHKQGRFLLNVANHVVACVDGHYYDSWDCGEKCVYNYWEAV